MIDKEYLDKLKKEDYIAYDDLMNDPMVTGQDTSPSGFILICIIAITIIGFIGYLVIG